MSARVEKKLCKNSFKKFEPLGLESVRVRDDEHRAELIV